MCQMIVVGHGQFGPALVDTAQMLIGGTPHIHALTFPVGTAVNELATRLSETIDSFRLPKGERALVLCDVLGGSPSRVSMGEHLAGRAEVLTGVNLPMLIEAATAPSGMEAPAVARRALQSGRGGLRDMGAELEESSAASGTTGGIS